MHDLEGKRAWVASHRGAVSRDRPDLCRQTKGEVWIDEALPDAVVVKEGRKPMRKSFNAPSSATC